MATGAADSEQLLRFGKLIGRCRRIAFFGWRGGAGRQFRAAGPHGFEIEDHFVNILIIQPGALRHFIDCITQSPLAEIDRLEGDLLAFMTRHAALDIQPPACRGIILGNNCGRQGNCQQDNRKTHGCSGTPTDDAGQAHSAIPDAG